ncbi:MAG: tetratricopeptide repeat protein [Bradyrhizobium sp.]
MTRAFKTFVDAMALLPGCTLARPCSASARMFALKQAVQTVLFVLLFFGAATLGPASADGLTRGSGAYSRGDYARAVRELIPAAQRGNARAQAQLGFMYENGFGVPQNYAAAADLYQSAAVQGDVFAQSRLGLSYDKGRGVPQNVILSYKWLDLAAAKATNRERDYYRRLRDAVASKMSSDQIVEGQRLAFIWASGGW